MGKMRDVFGTLFSKNNDEETEENNVATDDENSYNRVEESEYKNRVFDTIEEWGMTENEMLKVKSDLSEKAQKYYEERQKERKSNGHVNEFGEIPDGYANADYDEAYLKFNANEFNKPLYDYTMSKDQINDDLNVRQIQDVEFIVEGINSHYGNENIEHLNIKDRKSQTPRIYAKLDSNYANILEEEHLQSFNREDIEIMKMNDPYEVFNVKENGNISKLNIGDMSFDYQNMKTDKLKDFTILKDTEELNITLDNGNTITFYNSEKEKENFNKHFYQGSGNTQKRSFDISKMDISVENYMDYGMDKYNNQLETNSINKHVEDNIQMKKESNKNKKNNIEL